MFKVEADGSGGNQINSRCDEIEETHKYDQTNETRNLYFCNRSENMPICCRWCYMREKEWGENIICIPNEFHCATNRVKANQLKLGDIDGDDETMKNVWRFVKIAEKSALTSQIIVGSNWYWKIVVT